jgi:hypothetical protein
MPEKIYIICNYKVLPFGPGSGGKTAAVCFRQAPRGFSHGDTIKKNSGAPESFFYKQIRKIIPQMSEKGNKKMKNFFEPADLGKLELKNGEAGEILP